MLSAERYLELLVRQHDNGTLWRPGGTEQRNLIRDLQTGGNYFRRLSREREHRERYGLPSYAKASDLGRATCANSSWIRS
ncbi:hypothetical protein ACH427_27780 [Streptomyces sp. NPDC020379]|uniref:hypothetical protein n=1 Tax=Streptomyces sp. NPDC020379 TaxID=3365071 RepID=UPI00379BB67B